MNITVSVRHPILVACYGVSVVKDGTALTVSELIAGGSLRARMEKGDKLSRGQIKAIACDVAAALTYLHARNIVHRDVSSPNVLLQSACDGTDRVIAKLSDLGAANFLTEAKLTRRPGNVAYMAPEGASYAQSAAMDIYSTAVLIGEMCVRRLPATLHEQRLTAIDSSLSSLWPSMRAILLPCLSEQAALRPTASQLAQMLHNLSIS